MTGTDYCNKKILKKKGGQILIQYYLDVECLPGGNPQEVLVVVVSICG